MTNERGPWFQSSPKCGRGTARGLRIACGGGQVASQLVEQADAAELPDALVVTRELPDECVGRRCRGDGREYLAGGLSGGYGAHRRQTYVGAE